MKDNDKSNLRALLVASAVTAEQVKTREALEKGLKSLADAEHARTRLALAEAEHRRQESAALRSAPEALYRLSQDFDRIAEVADRVAAGLPDVQAAGLDSLLNDLEDVRFYCLSVMEIDSAYLAEFSSKQTLDALVTATSRVANRINGLLDPLLDALAKRNLVARFCFLENFMLESVSAYRLDAMAFRTETTRSTFLAKVLMFIGGVIGIVALLLGFIVCAIVFDDKVSGGAWTEFLITLVLAAVSFVLFGVAGAHDSACRVRRLSKLAAPWQKLFPLEKYESFEALLAMVSHDGKEFVVTAEAYENETASLKAQLKLTTRIPEGISQPIRDGSTQTPPNVAAANLASYIMKSGRPVFSDARGNETIWSDGAILAIESNPPVEIGTMLSNATQNDGMHAMAAEYERRRAREWRGARFDHRNKNTNGYAITSNDRQITAFLAPAYADYIVSAFPQASIFVKDAQEPVLLAIGDRVVAVVMPLSQQS